MNSRVVLNRKKLPNGVMLNAYPDSIGGKLSDIVNLFKRIEIKDVFSLFYILPTFFNSGLDRGFSIVDYDFNEEFVSGKDIEALHELNITCKFDFILNHLSVKSPQFQDLLKNGDQSRYKNFFIDWNDFWASNGEVGDCGYVIPKKDYLQKLFMRKPGFPVLKIPFPDGSDRYYWNTFYQEVKYQEISPEDLSGINGILKEQADKVLEIVNNTIKAKTDINEIDLGEFSHCRNEIIYAVKRKCKYLGQMDLNAQSEDVWIFYEQTLKKLQEYGAKIVRLDAFAYLHKVPGMVNFFNKPGTWEYMERLKTIADRYNLTLLPEIHSEYGSGIHEELAERGYLIYDFFFPGLVIDALLRGTNKYLLRWIREIIDKNIKTVNMLGCHDGIPVIDLRGKEVNGMSREGLLTDEEIDVIIEKIIAMGGRVKNLYDADGKKISYYQVNATFFSALGENEQKLRLARAIQMFMPGIPQVWYLDLFAGKNNYKAADRGGAGGHKEINRTNLTIEDVERGLKRSVVLDQLQLMRLRNTSSAFDGILEIRDTDERFLSLKWSNNDCDAELQADLCDFSFTVKHKDGNEAESLTEYR